MEPANLMLIKDWQISQKSAPPAKEVPVAKSYGQVPNQPRKGRHLDVDQILRRSLPKVSSQSYAPAKEIDE